MQMKQFISACQFLQLYLLMECWQSRLKHMSFIYLFMYLFIFCASYLLSVNGFVRLCMYFSSNFLSLSPPGGPPLLLISTCNSDILTRNRRMRLATSSRWLQIAEPKFPQETLRASGSCRCARVRFVCSLRIYCGAPITRRNQLRWWR